MDIPATNNADRRAAFGFLALVCLIILAATLGRGGMWAFIYEVRGADKIAHLILVGGLTFAVDVIMRRRRLWRVVPLAGLLVLLIATVEEGSQIFVPTRTFDLLDLACNYAGVAIASIACVRGDPKPPK